MDQPTSDDQRASEDRLGRRAEVAIIERRDIQLLFFGVSLCISLLGIAKLILAPPPPEPGKHQEGDISTGFRVNINTATADELLLLPQVGPVLAERIMAERVVNGPFETVEDLARTPGIGPERVTSFRPLIDTGVPGIPARDDR